MKIVFRDAGIFFRHQCELVLRHQMLVSNYFVKFFYSVETEADKTAGWKLATLGFEDIIDNSICLLFYLLFVLWERHCPQTSPT
jgi:hypothetical protein